MWAWSDGVAAVSLIVASVLFAAPRTANHGRGEL